jgi:hypothetical protein
MQHSEAVFAGVIAIRAVALVTIKQIPEKVCVLANAAYRSRAFKNFVSPGFSPG